MNITILKILYDFRNLHEIRAFFQDLDSKKAQDDKDALCFQMSYRGPQDDLMKIPSPNLPVGQRHFRKPPRNQAGGRSSGIAEAKHRSSREHYVLGCPGCARFYEVV